MSLNDLLTFERRCVYALAVVAFVWGVLLFAASRTAEPGCVVTERVERDGIVASGCVTPPTAGPAVRYTP